MHPKERIKGKNEQGPSQRITLQDPRPNPAKELNSRTNADKGQEIEESSLHQRPETCRAARPLQDMKDPRMENRRKSL
eukprot:5455287-Karenia_brevis.AAC.1